MDDELPQLSAEEKAKYTSFWSGYFKKGSKSSQSLDSETLPAPVTPATSVPAPSTPDTLETLIQRARDDPSLRAMLLSSLGASPAPTDSRLPEPPQPLPTAAPVALTPVPSPAFTMPENLQPPPAVPSLAAVPPVPSPASTMPEGLARVMHTNEAVSLAVHDDFKCSSKSHPNSWAKMGRFVLRNENCKELAKAWQSLGMNQRDTASAFWSQCDRSDRILLRAGGDQRLATFQKWVASGGRGLELEAAVQMKVIRETEVHFCRIYRI